MKIFEHENLYAHENYPVHERYKRVCATYNPALKMHESNERVCAPAQDTLLAPAMHETPIGEPTAGPKQFTIITQITNPRSASCCM